MAWNPLRTARESRERELEAADRWRTARKRSLTHERSTSHNKKSMAEALHNQSIGGNNGAMGEGRL